MDEDEATFRVNAEVEKHDFEAAELYRFVHTQGGISHNLLTAVKRAEKSHVVRRQLRQFDDLVVRVASERIHSANSSFSERSRDNDLQLGYDKLKVFPMDEVDINVRCCIRIDGRINLFKTRQLKYKLKL